MHAMNYLAPHAGGLEHVAFIDARHLTATLACGLKGLTSNALDLVLAILHNVHRALTGFTVCASALLVVETLMATKVDATRKLAHEHHVNTLDDLGLKGGGTGKRVVDLHRAKIGVKPQSFANAQETLLGTRSVWIGRIPLGSAYARQQNGVGRPCRRKRGLGQRICTRVNRGSTDKRVLANKLDAGTRSHCGKNLLALSDDLGSNAVAWQGAYLIALFHVATPIEG